MRVMITGAGGMLADALGVRFAASGHESIGMYYSEEEMNIHRARFGIGEVMRFGPNADQYADLEGMLAAARFHRPDTIVHCAAWTDVDGCEFDRTRAWESNAQAVAKIAMVANESRARLIHLSTDYVFDGARCTPYTESDEVNPLSWYGKTKHAGEQFALLCVANALVARSSWLYGPGGKNFVDTIRTKLLSGEEVRVVDDQRGCPTFTGDLAEALVHLLEIEVRGLLHVAGTGSATWFEFAREIGRIYGRESQVFPISTAELGRPASRPAYSVLDCARLEKEAGLNLPDWQDALRRYLHAH